VVAVGLTSGSVSGSGSLGCFESMCQVRIGAVHMFLLQMGHITPGWFLLDDVEVEDPEAPLVSDEGEVAAVAAEALALSSETPEVLPEPPDDVEVLPNDPETPDVPEEDAPEDELRLAGPSDFLPSLSLSILSKNLFGFGENLNFT